MIKEEVPQILGEVMFNASKDKYKVGLERFYGMFSGVAAMDIRRYKLELDVPIILDDAPVVSIRFVVEDL